MRTPETIEIDGRTWQLWAYWPTKACIDELKRKQQAYMMHGPHVYVEAKELEKVQA